MNGMNFKNFSTGTFCFKSVLSSKCGCTLSILHDMSLTCPSHYTLWKFDLPLVFFYWFPGSIHNSFHFISDPVSDRGHLWLPNAFTLFLICSVDFFRTGIMCISGHYNTYRKETHKSSWLRKMVAFLDKTPCDMLFRKLIQFMFQYSLLKMVK